MRTISKAIALSVALLSAQTVTLAQTATPVQLKASDAAANRYFGTSASISGDMLAIGAPLASGGAISNNDGSVYLFRWTGTAWSQEQKIAGPSAISGTQTDFGRSVAISGETLVVGARLDDTAASDAGAAYVYVRIAGLWTFQQKLTASNAAANDNFGDAVAIDGDTIVVAASGADAGGTDRGSVYAFVRSGNVWSQQAILPAMTGAANGDKAGENGALSINGDTVAVGAPSKTSNAGAVALYSRQIATWTNTTVLASPDAGTDTAGKFGSSVSVKGDVLAAGAINSSKTVATGGGAYIYRRTSGTWGASSSGVLVVPSGLATGDSFGSSIILSGNTLLVGSQGRSTNTGAAYSFRFQDGAWSQEALILAPDAAVGDFFGFSVSMDGNIAAIGAQADDFSGLTDAGSAWVFSRENNKWLNGPNYASSTAMVAGDSFGFAAAIDGNYAIIGAYTDTVTAVGQGSASIFTRGGTNWTFQQMITATGGTTNDNFGRSVSISGSTALVGAPSVDNGGAIDQGAVYFFNRSGATWTQTGGTIRASDGSATDYFGTSVGISGDYAVVGAYADDTGLFINHGSAYVFERNANGVWQQIARLEASDKASNDLFGYASAISGNLIVVGAHNKSSVGSAYIFAKDDVGTFKQVAKLSPNDPSAGALFGVSVATDGEIVVVGAQGKPAAYVYAKQSNNTWTQVSKLTAPDGNTTDGFGVSVSASNRQIAVATVTDRRGAVNGAGSAYLFTSSTGLATGPYVTQYRVNPISTVTAAGDGVGYSVGISGGTIVGGSFTGTGITGRATEFTDVTDSALTSVVNLTAQNTATDLASALEAATADQTIIAAAGAFSQSPSVNFGGKAVTAKSRSTIQTPATTLISMANGAVLTTASGYPMSVYGTLRTSNDSGRSDLVASNIYQGGFGSWNIGEHEVSMSATSATFDGKTTLQSTKSGLSTNGTILFRGSLTDLFGGRLTSAGPMTFDGIVNLKSTSITSGGTMSIETNTNMAGVTVSSPANVVTGGGRWVFGGTLMGPLNNSGKIITAGASSIYGSIINNSGATIDLTGGATALYGSVVNNGTITGSFSGCPTCVGLPVALQIESDMMFNEGAGLAISGGSIEIGRSFQATALDSHPFNMLAGGIRMSNSGQGASTFEAMSHDYGPAGAVLHADIDSSFPIGILEVGPKATVLNLVDLFDNDAAGQSSREAVYVETLIVNAGSRLNTGGIRVYARYSSIAGTVDNISNVITLGGPCDADLKIDAMVDDADFSLFVSAYNVSDCSDNAMPRLGGGGCRADLNFDGFVDDADFQIFVGAYDRLLCD
ncbi:MAG: hypothetical protein KF691_08525 [Phycisphaeraceae bacterium]|nr:hypothetical protein [Phycisphaeraceae bacterium]